jgi:hypothetical protein
MPYHVIRFSTDEPFATFIEHSQAVAAARDLARLHSEPFAIRAALQYDNELLTVIGGKTKVTFK